ncbi:hypothetical protein [Brumimicrobium aurantiacum]|uniref:Uncharacterized protein n=1 Tax=Brumimicrobium aurantiacum TaxID=1737063 RepID=A0A3E1EZ48_9FLAO|nr:hypothetical protein [Brumimicrobium aurantiacum]RFC54835.1 hypothetical protein DXU93_07580 [Brumimicrobium aurantiacum]
MILKVFLQFFGGPLPFVGDRFKLYELKEIEKLIAKSNLKMESSHQLSDLVMSKAGDEVERKYSIVTLIKG